MRTALAFAVLASAVGAVWLWAGRAHRSDSAAWRAVERDLDARFSDVPATTTGALADRLGTPDAPLLVDARTPEEYAVSHLPGARRVDPGADPSALAAALADVDRQREVVVYCSVGVRSAGVARRLREIGFARVENLRGSIFQWANEGRPLVRDGRPATTVHPYNPAWGRLLAPDLRAEVP